MINFDRKLRQENHIQNSGVVNYSVIKVLKNKNFFIVDIHLDGDAPKQYIKAYFYKKGVSRKSNVKSWGEYFAKFGSKSYPNESVIEYTINKIGEALGISINETELVIVNNQIRFLSKNFLNNGQKLIHGIEIIAEYFEDEIFIKEIDQDRKERRKYITFELIEKSIRVVYPKSFTKITKSLIELITFDAIVGNNDRHHYNWGLIGDIEKGKNRQPYFAPAYDTARALLWNKTDRDVMRMYRQFNTDTSEIISYVNRSKPRISFEGNEKANHFDLIKYLCSYNEEYKNVIVKLVNYNQKQKTIAYFDKYLYNFFILERSELIKEILRIRFSKLMEIVK